jgi:tRNA nucleotidyltransferase (CCA-adding enzyme)
MGGTKVSYTTATPSDVYGSVSAGANLNIYNDIDFFVVASARSSEENTESYQASFGIKGKF